MKLAIFKSAPCWALVFICIIPSVSWGAITLAAEETPIEPPWAQPANLSLERENGINTVTADLVLRYRSEPQRASNKEFVSQGAYSFGAYLHRDNTVASPMNDRGIQASYSGLLVPNWSNAGPVGSFGYTIKVSTGKGLVDVDQADGSTTSTDKTKNRLVFLLGGFLQPAKAGEPVVGRLPSIMFFDGGLGLYFDESRGNGISGTGRVNGGSLKFGFNYAPIGLEPVAVASLAAVPTFRASAQTQHDLSASGSRTKKTRNLYSVEMNLLFAQPDTQSVKLTPSLQISRSIGADLLTGRADSAKTELSFGLTF